MRESAKKSMIFSHGDRDFGHSIRFIDTVAASLMFQIVWFDVLLFQTGIAYIILALMSMHLVYTFRTKRVRLLTSLACLMFVGVLFDSLLTWFGVFSFDAPASIFAIPRWLSVLWFAFVLSLPIAFYWLVSKTLKIALVFGLLAPVSYTAGREFGLIEFSNSDVAFISLAWFAIGALASFVLQKAFNKSGSLAYKRAIP